MVHITTMDAIRDKSFHIYISIFLVIILPIRAIRDVISLEPQEINDLIRY